MLVTLAIIYALSSLLLATLLFVTAAKLNQAASTTGSALNVKIAGYEIGTSNVVVALGVLSVVTMIGMPAFWLYLESKIDDRPIDLSVRFSPPPDGPIRVAPDNGGNFVSQSPSLVVYKSRQHQAFLLEDPVGHRSAIPVVVWYDFESREPWAIVRDGAPQAIKDYDGTASGSLGPIGFDTATVPARAAGPATPTSPAPNRPAALQSLADPPAIAAARAATPTGSSP